MNGYSVSVDNHLKAFGETDDEKRTVKINVKASKAYGAKHNDKHTKGGSLANTIVHEILHTKDPRATEKETWDRADRITPKLHQKVKNKLYKLIQ